MAYYNNLNSLFILGVIFLLFSISHSHDEIKSGNELDFKKKMGPRSKRSIFQGEITKYFNLYVSIYISYSVNKKI
jgi:hypothetical protein